MKDPVPPANESPEPRELTHEEKIKNGRHAFLFFFIYLALYLGFVGLTAFSPETLTVATPIGGLNLAIVYGMVLIVGAIVLASLYAFLNRPEADAEAKAGQDAPAS